jgi:hypothetical protein
MACEQPSRQIPASDGEHDSIILFRIFRIIVVFYLVLMPAAVCHEIWIVYRDRQTPRPPPVYTGFGQGIPNPPEVDVVTDAILLGIGVLWLAGWVIWSRMLTRYSRRVLGLCDACGYDLRASPDICRECGKARKRKQPSAEVTP